MNSLPENAEELSPLKRALFAVKDLRAKLEAVEQAKTEPIAIIGMAGRFPGGATNPAALWQLLRNGTDAISEVPRDRWDVEAFYDPNPDAVGKMYTRWGGFLSEIDKFDPKFFGISPREAASMDPQQRLLLEVGWEALEHAGQSADKLAGSASGVFVGISTNDYMQLQRNIGDDGLADPYSGTGSSLNIAAGRLAYILGWHGPTMAVDTACSSSLVAIHLACQNLRAGKCALALAGGVNLILLPEANIYFCKLKAMATDGRCKTFDAAADGYVRSEACGIIVLKRLSDALANGDHILAVIRGSAINHDGRSSGLTVPNGLAQQAVIREALADAGGLAPTDIDYVETHGTGTPLGDPIEVRALAATLGPGRPVNQPLLLGSIKTNIGHAEAAAGITGVIKIILALQHQELPPHLHFNMPSPHIDWAALPVKVTTQNTPWPAGQKRRLAGINSFGLSGTNAHLLIEEAPAREAPAALAERPAHLFTLSAKSEPALRELAQRFADQLDSHPAPLAEVCFTANTGRAHFAHRLALTAASTGQLRESLAALATGETPSGAMSGQVPTKSQLKVAFLFTGQGAQYVGMGRQLYETQPTFQQTLDRCDELLRPYLNQSLRSIIYPQAEATSPLNQTAYTQPALFAIEYALAELWKSWGITPTAVLGHSVGEYVAACVAGVLSLEDALRLIAERGRLMQALPPGGEMLAVFADEATVSAAIAFCADQVSIAAINGPASVVISGAGPVVQTIAQRLKGLGIKSRSLTVSHAFHSPLMEPMLDEFEKVASQLTYAAPQMAVVSNVTGQMATRADLTHSSYWRRHVRQTVRFFDSIQTLQKQGYKIFLEIGPKTTLLGMGQQCWPNTEPPALWLPSLREGRDDWQQLLESLGTLYVHGANIDWAGFDADYAAARRRVSLPTYPFQRTRYWLTLPQSQRESHTRLNGRNAIHPLLTQRLRSSMLKETVFESEFSAQWPPFLKDHQIYGAIVFPGTGYIEMALAAAAQLGSGPCALESIAIHNPLILPRETEQTRVVQLVMSPVENDRVSFKILSLETDGLNETWELHATGQVQLGQTLPAPKMVDLSGIGGETLSPDEYYQSLRDLSMDYGTTFRGITQLWQGDGQAWAKIELPAEVGDVQSYHLHPALLDAGLQTFGAALRRGEQQRGEGDVYLPVGIGRLWVYRRAAAKAWARVTVRPGDSRKETLTGHLELFDETGQLAAELQELTFKRATRQALQGAIQKRFDDWLYEVAWRPKASNQTQAMPVDRWLIFADRTGVGEALASRLVEQGSLCDLVFPGETYAVLGTGRWQINPSGADDFERLMRESIFQESQLRRGVVYLWSAEADSPEETTLSILHLVQALSGDEGGLSRLWLVTRGAQPVTSRAAALALAQAPVWGLGKVIALEHPDLRCVCVDLDPAREADEAEILVAELLAEESEPQVAWRNLTRYVARLAHSATKAKLVTQPFELNITARGVLDNIVLRPLTRRQPGAGEIEIEVRASGLNFRDVLNVLGMYPGDPGPPGTECAGTVAAVGEGVTQLKVGDSVMGIAARAFNSYAISRADCVAPKPEHLSFAEAATIPIAFLTALYGLHHLAGMKPGARVLIHAAAGGVGLAAVQLAKQAGAEIFGTAGSPEKRAFLKSLGVQHVLNSRTLDFADEVMAITKGQGVDIVLNSLADEFIPKSLSVLAPEGCFLEIGKRGIWSAEQVKQLKPGATYFAYDLSDVLQTNGPLWRSMFQSLIADFERGALKPLPLQPFSTHEIVDAFRYMAQAKHTGKVVIVHTPVGDLFRADSSYLITGGLGGLGLKVAQWMVTQGVRHLALLGRSSASQTAREALREMEQAGVQVRVLQADVSQTAQVANRLAEIAQTMPPLRGIVHAAGILADSVLRQQDRERFIKVMGPKVAGSWTLHELTRGLPLDFFVLFSSASSLLGSAGQGNYAAANTFMDALAHDRQAQGLPALSINWGAWAEVGMAAGLGDRDQRRWSQQGMGLIQPEQGVQAFGQLLRLDVAQIGLLPIHWPMLKKQLGADVPPFWSEVVREAAPASANTPAAEAKQDLLNQLASTAPEARYALLLKHVQEQVARVFGLDPAQPLDLQQNLTEMGMDSLMAVELKNRIELNLGLALPMVKILEGPSVAELARQVLDQWHTAPANEAVPEAKPSRDDEQKEAERLLAQLDQLSEAEVDTLLTDLLAQEAHLS